jgi:hypothetical protein
MTQRPEPGEAAPYFFTYIDQVSGTDPLGLMASQLQQSLSLYATISEEASQSRYAPGKWSIRQALNHVTDTERAFAFRTLWFARGFESRLPGYDQNIAATGAQADRVSWADHVEEFRQVRLSTISLYRNLPLDAWSRGGIANDMPFTVRALAYIIVGHEAHHVRILQERYLTPAPSA